MDTYVSVDTIRKIEQETIHPRMNHFEKLCRCFGVKPGDYYRDSECPPEKTPQVSLKTLASTSPKATASEKPSN